MARKLVTLRKVKEINPIKNADMIERLTVDGWNVVSKKDDFEVGDVGVFFEVDSGLPVEDTRYDFLSKGGSKEFHGKQVYRIRTMRLRGVISQGLLKPLSEYPEIENYLLTNNNSIDEAIEERLDFSELLDVIKYEPPMKVRGADAAGNFPYWIRKTEQERINNVYDIMHCDHQHDEFVATLKMDGSSTTVAYITDSEKFYDTLPVDDHGGQLFVCSRNQTLKDGNSAYHLAVENINLYDKLKSYHMRTGRQVAVQGELLGTGVQGTREKIYNYTIHVFSLFDIDNQVYLPWDEVETFCNELSIPHVKVLGRFKPFEKFSSVDDFIDYANGIEPVYADIPEGVVFHEVNGVTSFKAISTHYLLKFE